MLIISTILIAINSFGTSDFTGLYLEGNYIESFWSALIYVSYNVIMAIAVLPVLGNISKDIKSINKSAIISGVIIGIFGTIICISLLINYGEIQFVEVPLALLANQSNNVYSILYFISFVTAVATTTVSALYGIYTRIDKCYLKFGAIVGVAYLGSLFGFSVLIKYLYTFMGYVGFIIIVMLLKGFTKRKNRFLTKNDK